MSIVYVAMGAHPASFYQKIKKNIEYFIRAHDKSFAPSNWFQLDNSIRQLWLRETDTPLLPDADAIVATSFETSEWIASVPLSRGKQYYLIQHFEEWSGASERVLQTFRQPQQKIVISQWLKDIVKEEGHDAVYIPNGLDFNAFGLDIPLAQRNPLSVLMYYNDAPWKGSSDGIEALELVREKNTALQVSCFGSPQGLQLPSWIEYHRTPAQNKLRELYNCASLFVAPSWAEGWGLPASEAMMCGAAVAATDNGGHREFCINGETALLSPPKDPESLAENIISLIDNASLRKTIAIQGNSYIRRFTWQRSLDSFESLLLED